MVRKTMWGMLAAALAFGMMVIGCDNSVTGQSEPQRYTVSFNANGADSGDAPEPVMQEEPETPVVLPGGGEMVKEGLVFRGWNTLADGTGINFAVLEEFLPEADTELFAVWGENVCYTITFSANGGGGAVPEARMQEEPIKPVELPGKGNLAKEGKSFAGWSPSPNGAAGGVYSAAAKYMPQEDTTLYAVWQTGGGTDGGTDVDADAEDFGDEEITATHTAGSRSEWEAAIADIIMKDGGTAEEPKNYVIDLTGSFSLEGSSDYTFGETEHIKVSIRGNQTISLDGDSTGNLLYIGNYGDEKLQTVILRDLTLRGHSTNNAVLVTIRDGGTLEMKGAAVITGNTNISTSFFGNAVHVLGAYQPRPIFIMHDSASIRNNTGKKCGAVIIEEGTFIMNGSASVEDNSAKSGYNGITGGGVTIKGSSTFTMNGNTSVRYNTVSSNYATAQGGGVYIDGGTFTMNDNAAVYGNSLAHESSYGSARGGGVFLDSTATFNMKDNAWVYGNRAASEEKDAQGGGVYVYEDATFNMGGGTVNGSGDDAADVSHKNIAATAGAALFVEGDGTARKGSFDAEDNFTPADGALSTTNSTIRVTN